jgi:DNA-directed RNA polymerase subunit RPC12/RpoP
VKKEKKFYEINIAMRMLDGENIKMKESILEKKFENEDMKYSCMFCENNCMTNNKLQKHKVEKHEIKCDYCNFNVGKFDEHMNTECC